MYGTAGAKGAGAKETFIPPIAHGAPTSRRPDPRYGPMQAIRETTT